MNKFILSSLLFLISFLSIPAVGQVTISPTNMFIADNARFGTFMVINGSQQTQEISIDFLFNYSKLNENGQRSIIDDDEEITAQYSIADHVRAFPRSFTLSPGQRQVIRLRLSPPNTLGDGTYWARIKTSATGETPPLEVQNTSTVAARVGITLEQVTGLFYKKGNVNTGITINNIDTNPNTDGTLRVLASIDRTGNSPFLGTITANIKNNSGRIVASNFISTSIYFSGGIGINVPIEDLSPGNYTLELTFETKRNDISEEDLVQMDPVSQTIPIQIN